MPHRVLWFKKVEALVKDKGSVPSCGSQLSVSLAPRDMFSILACVGTRHACGYLRTWMQTYAHVNNLQIPL